MTAARLPPRSEPASNQAFRPGGNRAEGAGCLLHTFTCIDVFALPVVSPGRVILVALLALVRLPFNNETSKVFVRCRRNGLPYRLLPTFASFRLRHDKVLLLTVTLHRPDCPTAQSS